MDEVEKLKQEIENKKEELKRLEEEQKLLSKTEPEYILAIKLHERFCHWNHTDGCSWFYAVRNGKHDWSDSAHKNYLEKARKLLRNTGLDKETLILVIDNL